MNFSELESLMSSRGVASLAEIARILNTTPQAVSNWKARNQVPHHVVAKLSQRPPVNNPSIDDTQSPVTYSSSPSALEDDSIFLSDILLTIAENLKIIMLVPFITVFLTFTYVKFIQKPLYQSGATILLPESKAGSMSGLVGLASSFGVNVPTGYQADLSSPSLLPKILNSRTFGEKIMEREFYTHKYKKKLTLLSILTHGDKPSAKARDALIVKALKKLNGEMLEFEQDRVSMISHLTITAPEPVFAKELAEGVLSELEELNRYFKSQTVSEKISFIENRIVSVQDDLETSEQRLKSFNEQNRQISSPALQLEQERLIREVDIQKGIYLTLKQQLELAKIEEVQQTTIIQVLDKPQVPLTTSNIKLRLSVYLAGIMGVALGIILGFVRAYVNNPKMDERKKLRRVKALIKKKGKDFFFDRRVLIIISITLLIGMPFFLGEQSKNPVFFGMYSASRMLLNTVYVLTLMSSISLLIFLSRKKN
jgi:uncharacterized protein involved in exopolysaccharide biosynthesis